MRVPSVLRRLCFLATFGPALLTLHAPGQELVAGGQTQSAPVSAATPTVTFVNPTTIACGDRTWDGRHVIVDACEVTIDCNHRFESLQVRNGGIVTHSAKVEEGLVLSIARDVLVDVGSKIDVSGKGYDVSGGPGVGDVDPSLNGSGGSHGGSGHSSASGLAEVNLTYGSVREPASLGSRGGGVAGGAGGGRLRLVVRGTLTVEGAIHADGAAGSGDSGGGSGGSIWITTRTLAGDGLVAADGGVRHSSGGCGGGGRVAVYFDEQLVPPATLRACGGPSGAGRNGGAGSVFTKRTADPLAKLVYDNCGANGARSILWDADEFGPGSPLAADLFVQGRAHVSPPEEERLELSVLGDVTIDPFARLSADSFGFVAGPGVGSTDPNQFGSGGSHGGSGHTSSTQLAPVGPTYGSIAAPLDFGSGGGGVGGGRGGGALRLWVAGTLTVEGIISADGQAGNADSGGGSGGSIWITTQVLAGDGVVAADGGVRHSSGGCGGGGRVAVYFDDQLVPPATLRACGGPSGAGRNGGAGSVFTKRTADLLAKLVYDNCEASGARSILWDADEFGPGSPLAADLFVQGRAHVSPPEEERLELSVLGDVTIDPFARLSADSFGLAAGPGVGSIDPNQFGSGGSHGGSGHTSSTQLAPVGPTYGSIAAPLDFGSGGGGVGGGRGGGALRLWVAGTLTIEGIISADGQAGNADSGGGSGGSIWITTQVLAGDGVVAADGGVRHSSGGCGGGGRVAVYFDDQLAPPATLRACGGPIGAGRNGGAGSVFTKRTADPLARLIYDNCLTNGAPTEIWSPIDLAADLVLRGRASLSVPRANGNGPRALVLALDGSATIEAESSIVVDARGWPAASGPGMGASLPGVGGGAGHGGPGAQSCGSPPAGGGGTYGQLDFPTDFGSGGGWSGGGAGGGALFLTLGGDLFLHGDVHANGEAATSNSGGGSGGSVLILANDVIGTFGVITANGGVGQSCGGGGGGGRVAILTYCPDLSLNLAFVAASGSDGGSDGSVFVGTILPPNANLTISSSDPASAFPVSAGSLAQEIMLLGAGPPPPGPGWMTAFRHNDFHTASAYQCPALGILETTGSLAEVTPPSTLDHNQYESDTEIRVFAERIEHVLSAPLAVDVENPVGSYSNSAALMPSTLAAGTVVNSHLLHFDTVQANQVTLTGSVTFDSRITGVILLNSTLDASDPELAVGTTTYPTGLTGRELEIDDPTDFFMVSPDGKTLSISSRVRSWMDEVRILTEVPDPIALPYVDPETFMPGVDEVSSGDCGSAFYRFTFELPPVFDNASLFGIANVDDQAVVFLNGTPISGAMTIPTCEPDPRAWPVDLCYLQLDAGNDRTDPSGRAILTWPTADCFITANSALFVPGTNELVFAVCGDASFWDPTGVEFSAVVRFD